MVKEDRQLHTDKPALNRHALEHARNAGLSVVASCSYTRAWVRRHPQYQDLLED